MTKRHKQKYRICRQVGEDIWGRFIGREINFKKRSGQHGSVRKKVKEFAYFFRDKKKKRIFSVSKYEFLYKLRKYYSNISKKQFYGLYNNNKILNINNRNNKHSKYFLVLLERRIDTLIYRVHWATSFFNARQIINHGHVLVNNKVVTNPSYILNIGDKIEIKKNSFSIIKDNILKNINNIYVNTPSYIEVNYNILTAMFLYNPHYSYIPYPTLRNISLIQNILLK